MVRAVLEPNRSLSLSESASHLFRIENSSEDGLVLDERLLSPGKRAKETSPLRSLQQRHSEWYYISA